MINHSPDHFEVRRIVIAIESSSHVKTAAESAATLAAHLHAELEGVLIQDINLARLAALPVGREIQFPTGEARDFTLDTLQSQNKNTEATARKEILTAAQHAHVGHSFRVAMGKIEIETIKAAEEADLLILCSSDNAGSRFSRSAAIARIVAEPTSGSVLIWKSGQQNLYNPFVCYDGSPHSKRALNAAARISEARGNAPTVIIIAQELELSARLRKEVQSQLSLAYNPKFLHCAQPNPDQICQLTQKSSAGILVISAASLSNMGKQALETLQSTSCPVLLIR